MSTSPKEQNKLLKLLAQEKTLAFTDVLQVFVNKNGKYTKSAVSEALNFLWVEDLFAIVHKDSGEELWINDVMFEAPQDYLIRFDGFSGKENSFSENYAGKIDKTDIHQLARHYCWAGVKQAETVRIIGDLKGSMILAERCRSARLHDLPRHHRGGRRGVQGVSYR